jgi:hypothetical protein
MQKRTLITAAGLAVAGLTTASSAQLLVQDSYPVGPNESAGEYEIDQLKNQPAGLQSLGFQTGPYNQGSGTGQFAVTTGGLNYPALGVDGSDSGKVTYSAAPIDQFTRSNARNVDGTLPGTSTFYVSHLVNRGNISLDTSEAGYVLTGFGNFVAPTLGSTSGFLDGVYVGWAQKSDTDEGSLVLRSRQTTAQSAEDVVLVDGDATDTQGITYNVVYKAEVNASGGTDNITWFLNPTDFTDDASLASSAAATGSFSSFAYGDADLDRLNYVSFQWNGNAFFDEPTIAASPSSLVVPEPATAGLLAVAGLAALRRRRN